MFIEYLLGTLGSIFTRSAKLELKFLKPKTKLASCSTVFFIFKGLTSQEEILIGNPRDFNAFHRSLALTIDSLNIFL